MNKFEEFSKEEGEKREKQEEKTERGGEEIPTIEKEETEEEEKKLEEKYFIERKKERYEMFIDFGIFEHDLEKLEGFDELSEGRQVLILENLRQLTLGRIQEQAQEEYEKGKSGANFLGKIRRSITKEYQIAKQEKITKEELMKGGMGVHGDVLKDLIKRAADGPEVELMEFGELELKYIPESEDLNPEQKETLKEFNEIASDFSKIPEEWRFETASLKNQKKHFKAKNKYDLAEEELLKLKTEEKNLPDAIDYVNKITRMVHENQFLNTHPDAERELERMSTSKAIRRVITTTAEKGGYMAAGYIARTATIGIMGLVGAPAAAAFLGGWRARQRTKESLKEQDIMARKGKEAKGETTKDVVKAESLTEKMTDFMDRIENINNKSDKLTKKEIEEKKKLFGMLKRRVNYTREKVQEGLVNFGGEKERLNNHYHLLETTAQAGVCSEGEIREDIENRLEKFLQRRGEKTEKARKKKLVKSMVRGALMSAGFAAAGVLARHAQEFFAEGTDEVAKALELSTGEIPIEKPIENFPEITVADTSETEIIPTDTLEVETIPDDTLETETIPTDTLKTETVTGETETAVGETEVVEVTEEPEQPEIPTEAEAGLESKLPIVESALAGHMEYQGGTSVWDEIENQLDERSVFQKMIPDFDKLGEAEHTHLVDYLKDKVVENPEAYGLPKGTDVGILTHKQLEELDWDKLFGESATSEEIMRAVPELSDIQKANILENNKILNELVQKTGKPIDSQTVDQTLTNVKEAGGVDEYLKTEAAIGGTEAVEATEEPETYLTKEQEATIVKAQQEATKEAGVAETIEATEEPETYLTKEQEATIVGAQQEVAGGPAKISALNTLNEQLDKGWFIFGGASSKQLESATEKVAQAFGLDENQADLFASHLSQGEEMSKKALQGLIKDGEVNMENFSNQIEEFQGMLHSHKLPQSSDWVPRTLGTGENTEIGLVRKVNENVYEHIRQADSRVQQLGADNLKLRINPEQPEVPTGTPEQASEKFGDETIRRSNK